MTDHSFAFIVNTLHEKSQCSVLEWANLSHMGLGSTIPAQVLSGYVKLDKLLNFLCFLIWKLRKLNVKQWKHNAQ